MLDGGKYAVFVHKGPNNTFRKTFEFIHHVWLPASEYELDQRDHFEILEKNTTAPAIRSLKKMSGYRLGRGKIEAGRLKQED